MKELERLEKKIEKLALKMEKMNIAEYIQLLNNPWRLLYLNFLAGIARGFGMAIGFTILGAFVIYILQKLIILNLPLISEIISDIVRLVREQSY